MRFLIGGIAAFVLSFAISLAIAENISVSGPGGASPGGPAGGDLSGTFPNPTVAKVSGVTINSVPASGNLVGTTDVQTLSSKTFVAPILGAATATSLASPIHGATADSTTAIKITKADLATAVMTFDTSNSRVGINKTPGAFDLDVNGAGNYGGALTIGGNLSIPAANTVSGPSTYALGATTASASGNQFYLNAANDPAISSNGVAVADWNNGATPAAILFQPTNFSGVVTATVRNQSNNSAAGTQFNVGNNGTASRFNILVNASANSGGNGTGSVTITSTDTVNTGGLFLATGSTNAITISKTQAVGLPGIASSSAATTGTVCWTTVTGNLTVDTTVACLSSLEELKDIKAPILGEDALSEVMRLKPFWYEWKQDAPARVGDAYEQPGLGAHQTESIDPRLVGYSTSGELRGVRYQQLTAVLIAAIQQQQFEIEALKAAR